MHDSDKERRDAMLTVMTNIVIDGARDLYGDKAAVFLVVAPPGPVTPSDVFIATTMTITQALTVFRSTVERMEREHGPPS